MKKKVNKREIAETISLITQIGINMIVPICIMVALSVWIDNTYGIKWISVPLIIIGILSGYSSVYRLVKKYIKKDKNKKH